MTTTVQAKTQQETQPPTEKPRLADLLLRSLEEDALFDEPTTHDWDDDDGSSGG